MCVTARSAFEHPVHYCDSFTVGRLTFHLIFFFQTFRRQYHISADGGRLSSPATISVQASLPFYINVLNIEGEITDSLFYLTTIICHYLPLLGRACVMSVEWRTLTL